MPGYDSAETSGEAFLPSRQPPEGEEGLVEVAHLLQYPMIGPPPASPSPLPATGNDAAPAHYPARR